MADELHSDWWPGWVQATTAIVAKEGTSGSSWRESLDRMLSEALHGPSSTKAYQPPPADWEGRLDWLRQMDPAAYELVIQLPPEYQKGLTLTFPIWDDEPFVGIEKDGKLMKPADPVAYAICEKLTQMLWKENPSYLRRGMDEAHRMRSQYPRDIPDDNPGMVIEG